MVRSEDGKAKKKFFVVDKNEAEKSKSKSTLKPDIAKVEDDELMMKGHDAALKDDGKGSVRSYSSLHSAEGKEKEDDEGEKAEAAGVHEAKYNEGSGNSIEEESNEYGDSGRETEEKHLDERTKESENPAAHNGTRNGLESTSEAVKGDSVKKERENDFFEENEDLENKPGTEENLMRDKEEVMAGKGPAGTKDLNGNENIPGGIKLDGDGVGEGQADTVERKEGTEGGRVASKGDVEVQAVDPDPKKDKDNGDQEKEHPSLRPNSRTDMSAGNAEKEDGSVRRENGNRGIIGSKNKSSEKFDGEKFISKPTNNEDKPRNDMPKSTENNDRHVKIDEEQNRSYDIAKGPASAAFIPATLLNPVEGSKILEYREAGQIVAEGFFWKKRTIFYCFWHQKYFVLLRDGHLVYHKCDGRRQAKGNWNIRSAVNLQKIDVQNAWVHPYRLALEVEERPLYFSFNEQEARDYWYDQLDAMSRQSN